MGGNEEGVGEPRPRVGILDHLCVYDALSLLRTSRRHYYETSHWFRLAQRWQWERQPPSTAPLSKATVRDRVVGQLLRGFAARPASRLYSWYNEGYYCEIETVRIAPCTDSAGAWIGLEIRAQGDGVSAR